MIDFLVGWFIVNAVVFLIEGIMFAALLVIYAETEGRKSAN